MADRFCMKKVFTGVWMSRGRRLTSVGWVLVAAAVLWLFGGRAAVGAEPAQLAAAYRAVLARNLTHARQWLEEGDLKSLAQGAANMQLLADLYAALGDDLAWQTSAQELRQPIEALAAAAGAGDASRCTAAIQRVEMALAASGATQPRGNRRALDRLPPLRRLMLAMDSVQADAKLAVLTGHAVTVKNQAVVLSELGRLVSNARRDEAFVAQSRAFVQAAEALAWSDEHDLPVVRQRLRSVAQRCDACHEGQRP